MKPAIIIMVKAPRAGTVKTRLCPPLSATQAAGLAASMVQDCVRSAQTTEYHVIIAYAPADGRAELVDILPSDLLWTPQPDGHLGDRMMSAFDFASEIGHSPLVMIGSDSPTVPPSLLRRTVETVAADTADLVLGPTEDGGYYLIGVRSPVPRLLDNVRWSTAHALRDTAASAESLNLRICTLPVWYDIDSAADLKRLRAELRDESGATSVAPATRQWLVENDVGDV